MKTLLLASLPALAAFFLLGATCVTNVEQKGPEGPWTGEVVNTGKETITYLFITAFVFDANGLLVGAPYATTCPRTIPPGQRAAFEFPPLLTPNLALPLRLHLLPIREEFYFPVPTPESVSISLLEKHPERRYVLAEVRNESLSAYRDLYVCAILRTADGEVAAVSEAWLFPTMLGPLETRVLPVFFSWMPDGEIEFSLTGRTGAGGWVVLDPSWFHVSATREVVDSRGRHLEVVGEVDYRFGPDLGRGSLQAFVAEDPAIRVPAEVGCEGWLPRHSTVPVAFTLPLGSVAHPTVGIVGIQGGRTDVPPFSVPVAHVSMQPSPTSATGMTVTATLTNPTSSWLQIAGICLNLRSGDGTLVGTSSVTADPLEPRGNASVSGEVESLAEAATAEVIAFGRKIEDPSAAERLP